MLVVVVLCWLFVRWNKGGRAANPYSAVFVVLVWGLGVTGLHVARKTARSAGPRFRLFHLPCSLDS